MECNRMTDIIAASAIAYGDYQWRVISSLVLRCLDQGATREAEIFMVKLRERERALGLYRNERGELLPDGG